MGIDRSLIRISKGGILFLSMFKIRAVPGSSMLELSLDVLCFSRASAGDATLLLWHCWRLYSPQLGIQGPVVQNFVSLMLS